MRVEHLPVRLAGLARRLTERPAVDRRRVAVRKPATHELPDERRRSTGRVELLGDVAAGRDEAREDRRARRDRRELVEPKLDARLAGEREQVQDAVRRAAACSDTGHRVQERRPVEEGSRGRRKRCGEPTCALRRRSLGDRVVRRAEPVAEDGEPEAVESHRHGVRGEVPGAGSRPGAGDTLEPVQLGPRKEAALLGADRLPDVLDRDRLSPKASRPHRAAVEDDRRPVEARQRHQRSRDGLVAADDADERVEVVRVGDELDRVGDHLPRDERCPHSGRALRLVVGDRDRVEGQRDAAGRGHSRGGVLRELELAHVARHRPGPGGGDPDDRPVEPGRVDAERPEVRSGRSTLSAVRESCARPPPLEIARIGHGPILSARRQRGCLGCPT